MSNSYTSELRKILESQGATFIASQDMLVPSSFGDIDVEIESFQSTVAISHIPRLGFIKCEGTDVLDLLQRMSTNNVSNLHDYQQIPTILTNENGRIIDILYLFSFDSSVYIICSPSNEDKVIDWLEKYTFMEDASFQNISAQHTFFQLQGPEARDLIKSVFQPNPSVINCDVLVHTSTGREMLAINQKMNSRPNFLIVSSNRLGVSTWKLFTDSGATPIGLQALEVGRVDEGIPIIGKEITEKTNPLEIGAIGAIDFAKGCYVGQEVIARLDTYQKVQKRLVVLESLGAEDLTEETKLVINKTKVGTITSISPKSSRGNLSAIGYVKSEYAKSGQQVSVDGNNGTVIIKNVPMPFAST